MTSELIRPALKSAIFDFLNSVAESVVGGLSSQGMPIQFPQITKTPHSPPKRYPYIQIMVQTSTGVISEMSPATVTQTTLEVEITIENSLSVEINEVSPYDHGHRNHDVMAQRIQNELEAKLNNDRWITDADTGCKFTISPEQGIVQSESGASWEDQNGYHVMVSTAIQFTMRSSC